MSSDWIKVLDDLEKGTVRAAIKENGVWKANMAVKEAILDAFRAGELTQYGDFCDKHTVLPQKFTPDRNIRIVPGSATVRRGVHVASGVIIMSPSYMNTGAFVDTGTLVDSHVLVGSCAQIGKNVHLSAGVQIGGVLEPIGESPVVIEDDAFIGAGSIIVEGVQVLKGAVIAPGTVLSKGVMVYDCVNERTLERGEPIPENAVVIPGTRPINPNLKWATENNLQVKCAMIVKYRDEKSNASLELEQSLR